MEALQITDVFPSVKATKQKGSIALSNATLPINYNTIIFSPE